MLFLFCRVTTTITNVPSHQYTPSWQRCQRAFCWAVTHWWGMGEDGSPYMVTVGHPTPCFVLVSLASPLQWITGESKLLMSWGEALFYSNTKHLFQCSKHMLFCMP